MKEMQLGQGLSVSAMGLGAMGMSAYYGVSDEQESIATLRHAVDSGVTFIDTAEAYGPFENERLIARALGDRRQDIVLATKFAMEFDDDGTAKGVNGSPEYARKAVDRSLRNLNTDHIDLLYLHRVDPQIPIEESVSGMAELVAAGKVRHLGLSEVASETIRRAHAVHPITAVQSEMSLFTRDVLHNGVKDTVDELGIGFIAFSPLGRGMLAGTMNGLGDLSEDDARRTLPRFQPDAVAANLQLVERVRRVAAARQVTVAQISLAWLIGAGVVPIPGTRRRRYLDENIAAADITLTGQEMQILSAAIPDESVVGARDTPAGLSYSHA